MFLKSGPNVKDSGCICNLSLIQQILPNNSFNNIRNLKQLIQHGDIQWNKQAKEFWLSICALKMDSYKDFKKQIKTFKSFKKN